jgi:DNA-directed RNA polymerase specialized sigma24 family protein
MSESAWASLRQTIVVRYDEIKLRLARSLGSREAADLSREMDARSSVEALKRAMTAMPARRRAILIAARVDGLAHDVIAKRFAISRTMVQKELRRAISDCVKYLGTESIER